VELPGVPVTVTVKQWGFNAPETEYETTTPVASFTCRIPPGAEGIRGLISTNRLDANQTWSSEQETVAPGDAITRTVTLSAEDVSAMAFPPMQHPELEGVGVYPGEPSVSDSTGRGSLHGERVETVAYVLERPGEVALPAIVLPWWDIDDQVLRRVELPGLSLEVVGEIVPEPAAEAAEKPAVTPRNLVLLVVAVVALALWLGSGLAGRMRNWLRARRESESAYFRRVTPAPGRPGPNRSSGTTAMKRPGRRPRRWRGVWPRASRSPRQGFLVGA
jgi:hypothetical protein